MLHFLFKSQFASNRERRKRCPKKQMKTDSGRLTWKREGLRVSDDGFQTDESTALEKGSTSNMEPIEL